MRINHGFQNSLRACCLGLLASCCVILLVGCRGNSTAAQRGNNPPTPYWPKQAQQRNRTDVQLASLQVSLPTIAEAEFVNDDELCLNCHKVYTESFRNNVHRGIHQGQACEACHGPASQHLVTRGKEPGTIYSFKTLSAPQKAEICLKCHTKDQCAPGANWRTSSHAHKGVSCTDCHTSHYNIPPGTPPTSFDDQAQAKFDPRIKRVSYEPGQEELSIAELKAQSRHMGAVEPQICYRCHSNKHDLEVVAHPHQIGGANSFQCSTCHDPHGKVKQESRTDLCLTCHKNAPSAPYHSSSHFQYGVACTDCHNPHPSANVQSILQIDRWQAPRPSRLPMSVDQPAACYKCHADIYAKTSMPSHHPIKEGKMICSDCHDAHGQFAARGNLNNSTVNLVCWKCHAEKQGPFAYEHPPVTQNCCICHEPHGTVAQPMLKQPVTFLCLRCHTGHRTGTPHPGSPNPPLADVGKNAGLQQAFYSDCTQCHAQIHGSDLPSPHNPKSFVR